MFNSVLIPYLYIRAKLRFFYDSAIVRANIFATFVVECTGAR